MRGPRGVLAAMVVALLAIGTLLRPTAHAEMAQLDPLHPDQDQSRVTNPDLGFPPVVPGSVDPDRYVIGPGDIFQVNFSGRVTRTLWLTVGPEGALFVPGAGALMVDGLTLNGARRALDQMVAAQFRGVSVDLRLARVRTMRIFLTGEVAQPGTSDVPAVNRVSEVLPASVLVAKASRRNITIERRNGERLIADLERFNRTGRDVYNPTLRDGDVVHVPVAKQFVGIDGAVPHTGTIELGPDDSLSTLVELAGGTLASALDDRCLLLRWRSSTVAESVMFSLPQLHSGEFNPRLRDGDRAYIFFQPRFHALEQAAISGEVVRPGTYPLVTGSTRLSDVVNAADGFLPRANLASIRLYRASPGSQDIDPELERLLKLSRGDMSEAEYERLQTRLASRHEDFRIDWQRLQKSPELDLVLVDGDVIRVEPVVSAVRVDGEVRRPGIVEYDSRRSVGEYVRLAGGYGQRAAPGRVLVTHAVTGRTLRARDVSSIAPGDMIWVPARPERTAWQNLTALIAVAAQVATVVFVVRNVQ